MPTSSNTWLKLPDSSVLALRVCLSPELYTLLLSCYLFLQRPEFKSSKSFWLERLLVFSQVFEQTKVRERNVCTFGPCGPLGLDSHHICITVLKFSCQARRSLHLQKLFQTHATFSSSSWSNFLVDSSQKQYLGGYSQWRFLATYHSLRRSRLHAANQLTKVWICGVCHFHWCKYSYHDQCQATSVQSPKVAERWAQSAPPSRPSILLPAQPSLRQATADH